MPFMYGITDQDVAGGTAITIVNRICYNSTVENTFRYGAVINRFM